MKLVAVTAAVWIAIAIVWWLTVGAEVAKAAKKQTPIDWVKIASFYAGRPVTLAEDKRGPMGGTTGFPESGNIFLGSGLLQGLKDFEAQWNIAQRSKGRARKDAYQRAFVYGVNPIAVLIHEAIHNRHFPTGPDASSEVQAQALGAELIPDLMNRFFGVKIGSPRSKQWEKAAKHRGEYGAAYDMAKLDGWNPILFAPYTPRPDSD